MPRKRRLKALLVVGSVVAVLVVVALVGVLFYVAFQLDTTVASAIEDRGSEIVGSRVSVGDVELSPWSGEGTLADLSIANPDGYSEDHALHVGKARVHLDPWSVLSADDASPVVIHDVEIRGMTISVEGSRAKVNIREIQEAINSARGDREPFTRRLKIAKLSVKGARIEVLLHAKRRSFERALDVPDFELTDLGGEAGAPAQQIAKEVFGVLASKARGAVGRAKGPFKKLRDALLDRLGELTPEERRELRRQGDKALKRIRKGDGKALRDRILERRRKRLERQREEGAPQAPTGE